MGTEMTNPDTLLEKFSNLPELDKEAERSLKSTFLTLKP